MNVNLKNQGINRFKGTYERVVFTSYVGLNFQNATISSDRSTTRTQRSKGHFCANYHI